MCAVQKQHWLVVETLIPHNESIENTICYWYIVIVVVWMAGFAKKASFVIINLTNDIGIVEQIETEAKRKICNSFVESF